VAVEPSAGATIAAALFGLLCVSFFFAFRKAEERRFLLPLALTAFTLKAVLVPLYYFALVRAGLQGFAYFDSYEYHLDGIEIARELKYGIDFTSRAWRTIDPGYPFFTGFVYWIVGPNTLAVRMLNAVFSSFMLLYVYRIAKLAFDNIKVTRWSCLLAAFLPYSILIVINHRKEAIVSFLAVFISYQAMRALRFDSDMWRAATLVLLGLGTISFFRSAFVLPFIGILFICYVLTQRSLIQAIILTVPTAIGLIALQLLLGEDAAISISASSARLQGKLVDSAALADAGGGLLRYVRVTSIWDIYKLPLSTVLVAILPFPPYWRGVFPSVLLSWMNIFNLIFLPHMLVGASSTFRGPDWRRRIPLLLIPAIFLMLIGAAHSGVVRYRETVFPLMLVLAGAGLARGGNLIICLATYSVLAILGLLVWMVRLG
jgi:4-amino-4-deoxy-L-arabinose transferase-like glycosyltransferase